MKEFTKHAIISFIAIIFMLISAFAMAYQHEAVHSEIYSYYGIDSSIHYDFYSKDSWLKGKMAYTEVTNSSQLYKCDDTCKNDHILNEIVGYNIGGLQISLWFMLLFYIIYKDICKSNCQDKETCKALEVSERQ